MCVAILQQGMDTDNSVRTPGGSFYCNAASSWNPAIKAGELVCPVHPICGQPPYESFALTPIFATHARRCMIDIPLCFWTTLSLLIFLAAGWILWEAVHKLHHPRPLTAPVWGVAEADYFRLCDPWPLNPAGELLLGVKIESPEGVARCEEILAVPGCEQSEVSFLCGSLRCCGSPNSLISEGVVTLV